MIHIMLTLMLMMDLETGIIDVKGVFMHWWLPDDKKIYMKKLKGFKQFYSRDVVLLLGTWASENDFSEETATFWISCRSKGEWSKKINPQENYAEIKYSSSKVKGGDKEGKIW